MYFESFADLIAMEGHGGYVWFCYGVAFAVITALFWQPIAKKKQFMKQRAAVLRRQQAQAARSTKGE